METLFKNYFWVVNVLAVLAGSYLTATTANEYVSDTLFAEAAAGKAAPKASAEAPAIFPEGEKERPFAASLEARHVFNADPKDDDAVEEPVTEEETKSDDSGDMEETSLNLTLVGTIVGPEPESSLATATLEGKSKLLRVGSELKRNPDDEVVLATVLEIARRYIVLMEGGKRKYVRLWDPDKNNKPGAPPQPGGPPRYQAQPPPVAGGGAEVDYSKGVRKTSMYAYEIDRGMLNEQLNDLTRLGREARIVPNYRNGQYQGFKLIGVRPGSLYRSLGIRSGDIIQRVNGTEINSPNKAIQLFEELKSQGQIELDIERRGQKRTLSYSIK